MFDFSGFSVLTTGVWISFCAIICRNYKHSIMKVLMFGWEFPPHNSGGLGVACAGLARALIRRGVGISFVLPRRMNASSDFLRIIFADDKNIKIEEVNSPLMPYITSEVYARCFEDGAPGMYGASLFEEVRRYGVLARAIARREAHNVIHAHDWLSFEAGVEAKKVSGKPLVVHIHATEFDRVGGGGVNQFVYNLEKYGMEKADAVIAVSHFTKNIITNHYGILPEKVFVVHNGIDEEASWEAETAPAFLRFKEAGYGMALFVGRITLQKGPDYFLRAAKRVLEYRPKTFFVIAGAGDMERQAIREAAALGISDKVFFAGFLRDGELAETYRAADIFVMPSVSEPFGITPLESLMHGAPVLISKQSGVSEVLAHAIKADFWDTEEMANKIIAVLDHKPLQHCLAENGRNEAKRLTWGEAARKCVEVYGRVLAMGF